MQIDPIEMFDLLEALNRGNGSVLGSRYSSQWLAQPRRGLALVSGHEEPPTELGDRWQWMRDPFPPGAEDRDFERLRTRLGPPSHGQTYPSDALDRLPPPDRDRLRRAGEDFFTDYNPYIRHVVRRTREFLENEIDPVTHEPYLPKVEVRLFGERPSEAVHLPGHLHDAYEAAEEFCDEVGKRPKANSGLLETLLLRRVGSSIVAGRKTALKMLGPDAEAVVEEEEAESEERLADDVAPVSSLYPLSDSEREKLQRFLTLLTEAGGDPKYREVERILTAGVEGTGPWLDRGCIVFTQYYDSAIWLAEQLAIALPNETVAVYAGSGRSGLYRGRVWTPIERDTIKEGVRNGSLRLLVGTDAASEGLNLQRLGTLINLDLPWNPTRLEQRKGRIQRIGQPRPEVFVYNLRYRGSVEDRVHQLLSSRLAAIRDIFGQLPDTLEDAWVAMAHRDEEKARQIIDEVPASHPFELRYDRIEHVDWESCNRVLDRHLQLQRLQRGW